MAGAFETGKYRNVFAEYGYPEAEIQRRVEQTFETIFYGNEEERFYHEVGADMAYIEDTGNHDVRTEGMSYGMMACVQMNRREEFDRLWKWTRTYMYIEDGPCKNYFAWSCATDGSKNAEGPAPDGEEYFAWHCFLRQTAGEMEPEYFTMQMRRGQFCGNASTRESRGIRGNRCGTHPGI